MIRMTTLRKPMKKTSAVLPLLLAALAAAAPPALAGPVEDALGGEPSPGQAPPECQDHGFVPTAVTCAGFALETADQALEEAGAYDMVASAQDTAFAVWGQASLAYGQAEALALQAWQEVYVALSGSCLDVPLGQVPACIAPTGA